MSSCRVEISIAGGGEEMVDAYLFVDFLFDFFYPFLYLL